jgi:hypothetical protein
MGLILFLAFGGPGLVRASGGGGTILFVGGTAILAVVAGMIAIGYKSPSPTAKAVSGIIGGIVIGAGTVVMVVLLACMAFLATCKCH